MGKKIDLGVSEIARKVKKGWIGDPTGLARKIKKGWIGDENGKARLCFSMSGGELRYYGLATDMTSARGLMGSATAGDYAIFAAGCGNANNSSSYTRTVDAYNSQLTKINATNLNAGYANTQGVSLGGTHAVFYIPPYSSMSGYIHLYDGSLTSTPTSNSTYTTYVGAASVGDYAVFAGGTHYSDSSYVTLVRGIDKSGTAKRGSEIASYGRSHICGASIGDYALFVGGRYKSGETPRNITSVVPFNTSLTRQSSPFSLSKAREQIVSTTIGDYAIFAGGYVLAASSDVGTTVTSNVVDACNASLTKLSISSMTTARDYHSAVTIGDYAMFAGGRNRSVTSSGTTADTHLSTIEIYDKSLTRVSRPDLVMPYPVRYMGAAVTGNYALFAGGEENNTSPYSKTVKVFEI